MTKRRLPVAGMEDLDLIEISSRPWRHGRMVTFVAEVDGAHWRFEIRVHHEEGWQEDDDVEAVQVHQVEKTVKVWEPVP